MAGCMTDKEQYKILKAQFSDGGVYLSSCSAVFGFDDGGPLPDYNYNDAEEPHKRTIKVKTRKKVIR
jgi:hypothetical protein